MDTTICQICREPIWNFLCISCLSDDIKKWLPKAYSQTFGKFHQVIENHFFTSPDNYEPCLNCGLLSEAPICPHCYTHEVYHWIKKQNRNLARNFSKIFFFYKFEGSELFKSSVPPVSELTNAKESQGVCDTCGEYADNLMKKDPGWTCESCSD